jgi:hypothetical protein
MTPAAMSAFLLLASCVPFEPSTWSLACSHGIGPGPLVIKSSGDAFRHAVFVAGDFTVHERTALGSPVRVAVWGEDWGSSTSDFADQCSCIVEFERAFYLPQGNTCQGWRLERIPVAEPAK